MRSIVIKNTIPKITHIIVLNIDFTSISPPFLITMKSIKNVNIIIELKSMVSFDNSSMYLEMLIIIETDKTGIDIHFKFFLHIIMSRKSSSFNRTKTTTTKNNSSGIDTKIAFSSVFIIGCIGCSFFHFVRYCYFTISQLLKK